MPGEEVAALRTPSRRLAALAVPVALVASLAAHAGDACSDCPCPTDVDRDGEVGFADVLMVVAGWGPCPVAARNPAEASADGDPDGDPDGDHDGDPCLACPCPPDVNRDGQIGQADILAVLVTWGPCAIDNDCGAAGVCPNFVFGCNGTADCTCVALFDGSLACQREWQCGVECPDGVCPPGFHCVLDSCCGATSCAPDSALCAPLGGCCVAGACVDPLTENACLAMGGLFLGLGVGCDGVDCGRGACCRSDAGCLDTVEPLCDAAGGNFLGEESECAACVGPCCLEDGSCVDGVAVPACGVMGGTFAGFDLSCADLVCPVGACCFLDGVCEGWTEAACLTRDGVFRGVGSGCGDCGFGACCLGGEVCTQAVEETCDALGGAFQGVATECFFCTIGACCLFDGSCINTNTTICGDEGGDFQGALVYCPDVECEPHTACCLLGEPCIDLTATECGMAGGFADPFQLCAERECPELGACCINGQFCHGPLTEPRCEELNGVFLGVGTMCQTENCTILRVGACCLNGPEYCVDSVREDECIAMGGFYPGDGTMCKMSPCD